MDAVGSNIRVDARGREVMRILPRTHDDVNEEWISDKTRFVWDGLRTQRLDRPYVREFGKLRAATWPEAFLRVAQKVKAANPERIGIILGDLVAAEEAFSARQLADLLGIKNIDCRQDGTAAGRAGRPRRLSLQHRHCRNRRGRCHPAHRHQSAARGAGAQRPHPQALPQGRGARSASSASRPTSPIPMPILVPVPTACRPCWPNRWTTRRRSP